MPPKTTLNPPPPQSFCILTRASGHTQPSCNANQSDTVQHTRVKEDSHGPVGMVFSVLKVLAHASEKHLDLLNRPAEDLGEEHEGQGLEGGRHVHVAPDAWHASVSIVFPSTPRTQYPAEQHPTNKKQN